MPSVTQKASRDRRKSASTSQHQQEAAAAVAQQRVAAAPQGMRVVLPDRERDTLGNRLVRPGHVLLQRRRRSRSRPGRRRGRPEPPRRARRRSGRRGRRPRSRRPPSAISPSGTRVPSRRASTHEVLELAAAVGLPLGAEQDLAARGLDAAAGQVEGRAADRLQPPRRSSGRSGAATPPRPRSRSRRGGPARARPA